MWVNERRQSIVRQIAILLLLPLLVVYEDHVGTVAFEIHTPKACKLANVIR